MEFFILSNEQLQVEIQKGLRTELEQFSKHLQPKESEEYLTRQEVADLLKVNLTTLWSWTKKGKLISYGIGNRVYYKRTEVEKALIEL